MNVGENAIIDRHRALVNRLPVVQVTVVLALLAELILWPDLRKFLRLACSAVLNRSLHAPISDRSPSNLSALWLRIHGTDLAKASDPAQ
jgi:hypothetical protein